uniref:VIR_N domain-containing protein n=1 Tax=Rhodnius prolixus TaxID=13249 RepID=T1IEL7_RHOPR
MSDLELLFFDTFSHESSEEINLDLVQFPKPIYIGEVRIIPLGARVQADFPGGVRLGATNPSQFKIEFFVNDLSKPGAPTFEHLGSLEYNQNGSINLECENSHIPTDGLVLYGWYTTITLAVYGVLTKTIQPDTSNQQDMFGSCENSTGTLIVFGNPSSRAPRQYERRLEPGLERVDPSGTNQQDVGTPEYDSGPTGVARGRQEYYQTGGPAPARWSGGSAPSGTSWEQRKRPHTPPPPTPPPPPSPALAAADTESPQQAAGNGSGNEAFEPILSDDELPDDQDPASSWFEPSCRRDSGEGVSTADGEALKNLVMALPLEPQTSREVWVETVEQVINCLPKSFLALDDNTKRGKFRLGLWKFEKLVVRTALYGCNILVTRMIDSVSFGLNFSEALAQPQPGLKIRHIKAGIRLVEALSNCGEEVCMKMLEQTNAQDLLLNIYHEEYMALVIKLMVLRSLDSTLRYKPCVERFVNFKKKLGLSGYQRLLEMIQGNQHARIKFPLSSLIQKLHFYELLMKFEFLSMALEQILRVYIEAPTMISQPKRFLPVSAQFEINSTNYPDPYKAIYTYFRFSHLLKNFITLLSHPSTSCCLSIVAPINSLISELLETDDGMKFLASSDEMNSIIRLFLGVNPTLGLHLAYRLQALSYLDSINSIPEIDPDKPEVLDYLQGNIGKSSVVHVLSQGDNMEILLKVLKHKSTRKRSPSRGYICDLIILCIKLTTYVPFLQKYCETIIELSKNNFPELTELQKWLRPIEISSISCDISKICEFVKNSVDVCTPLPGELITAVRLLRYLGMPKNDSDLSPIASSSDYKELKYKCAILDLYSLDGLTHFTTILQKLNSYYEYPHLYSSRLIAKQGLLLLSFVLPAVQLMRRMLTYVIRCRNTNFKDLTAVPVLLQTYNLMQAIPMNAQAHTDAVRAGREIIETLLAYTQPVSSETCTENEALNKSLWTSMVAEVIKFTTEIPLNFTSGLMILSELLPLPLPLQTKDLLTEDENTRFVNSRKLWSAHLHSLNPLLENMISTMSISRCQPLLQILRRVCIQLADLAAPTALTVVKTILDTLGTQFSTSDNPKDPQLTRLLKFLTCLITHSAIKAAFLSLIKTEKYHTIFQTMLDTFRLHSPIEQNNECLVSIFQCLIDTEISLVQPPGHQCSVTAENFLANALPNKDTLIAICNAMLEHISNEHAFSVGLTVIRTFLLLVEHDFGFYYFKTCLEKNGGDALHRLLTQISADISHESPVTLATLSTSLELCRALTSTDQLNRTAILQPGELANLLKWPHPEHPLLVIEEHLKTTFKEEGKSLERLLEIEPPTLPQPESLLGQFALRTVSVLVEGEDDSVLSTAYWLSAPKCDDQQPDPNEQVPTDLMEIAKNELGGLCLQDAISKLCQHKDASKINGNVNVTKNKTNEPSQKKLFIAPMRGRGAYPASSGAAPAPGGPRGDMFRSRPPNTSRPPSLHVDDFVALETCG